MSARWRPGDEAEATGNRAALLEWLRASGAWPDAHPDALAAFAIGQKRVWLGAIAAFLGLHRADGPRGALLGAAPLVFRLGPERRMLDAGSHPAVRLWQWDAFVADAAGHLLCAETRPSDRLLWVGDREEPWPIAGLLFGAQVILAINPSDAAALAAVEGATVTWSAAQLFPSAAQAACLTLG